MMPEGAIKNLHRLSLRFIALGVAVLALWVYNAEVISFSKTHAYIASGSARGWSEEALTGVKCQPDHDTESLLNQTYGWFGNQFVPPPHVPLYSKQDMLKAFSEFDVLWIGDSTTRRAYATLYGILNSSSEVISVNELNNPRVIDVNKYASSRGWIDENSCGQQRVTARQEYLTAEMEDGMWTKDSLCRKVATRSNSTRSFDYVRANCYKDVWRISQESAWDLQRYSLIIVGAGVWEAIRTNDCDVKGTKNNATALEQELQGDPLLHQGQSSTENERNSTRRFLRRKQNIPIEERLDRFGLSGAGRMASILRQTHEPHGRPYGVLWRTTGLAENNGIDAILKLNRQSIEWIHHQSHQQQQQQQQRQQQQVSQNASEAAVTLVDWGAAILPRSLSPQRIAGDIKAHYGLEARLLMAQMTTQQVVRLLKDFDASG